MKKTPNIYRLQDAYLALVHPEYLYSGRRLDPALSTENKRIAYACAAVRDAGFKVPAQRRAGVENLLNWIEKCAEVGRFDLNSGEPIAESK